MTFDPIALADIAAGRGGFALFGETLFDQAGSAVARAGDINGDGLADFIIGAPAANDGRGEAYVVYGTETRPGAPVELADLATGVGGFVLRGAALGDAAGTSVGAAGDINGDGFDDLVIGVPGLDGPGASNGGGAFFVLGGPQAFRPPVLLQPGEAGLGFLIRADTGFDYAGRRVAAAGDVNGDGISDVLIGALAADDGATRYSGTGYIVFGSQTPFPATGSFADLVAAGRAVAIRGENQSDNLYAVASAGDVNGDGFDDVLLGSLRTGGFSGAAYLVFGAATGLAGDLDLSALLATGRAVAFRAPPGAGQELAGTSITGAGDVNGDGFADLLIGAQGTPVQRIGDNAGVSYLVLGGAGPLPAEVALGAGTGAFGDIGNTIAGSVILGRDAGGLAGAAVAGGGDLNGDGFDDLVIGAPFADPGDGTDPFNGLVYVVFGRAGGLPSVIDLTAIEAGDGGLVLRGETDGVIGAANNALRGDRAGSSVASLGDVDGDGFDDLLIGAPFGDAGGQSRPQAGDSYIVFGGAFLAGLQGGDAADTLRGVRFVRDEAIAGGAGDDVLLGRRGDDTLIGGDGDDRLDGGAGSDVLSGGAGSDRFGFRRFAPTDLDRILDFDAAEGDRIRMRRVDADLATPDDDAFRAIGTAAFSGAAGELRWAMDREGWRIEGDVDGDAVADIGILVLGTAVPDAGWFAL